MLSILQAYYILKYSLWQSILTTIWNGIQRSYSLRKNYRPNREGVLGDFIGTTGLSFCLLSPLVALLTTFLSWPSSKFVMWLSAASRQTSSSTPSTYLHSSTSWQRTDTFHVFVVDLWHRILRLYPAAWSQGNFDFVRIISSCSSPSHTSPTVKLRFGPSCLWMVCELDAPWSLDREHTWCCGAYVPRWALSEPRVPPIIWSHCDRSTLEPS